MTSFFPPSYRAAASDLTVSVSPLGLVELADEEFEVHGPRLNRYSSNWAWYLGHHWAYKRPIGESQLTFNYVKALADWHINFSFGKGVQFTSPEATSAIIPHLLHKTWNVDNEGSKVLWEIGQQGIVSGDVFVKVAYEPPYQMPNGMVEGGKIRILPINPAHAFCEFHPHDRSRFMRFKLKYKFWGTGPDGTRQVHTYTEILTDDTIEEYVNDELIDSRPNPLGVIPIVHCTNVPVASSPWGLSDISDIISLNREFNERATDISEIIAYHAAPVTVITGAKASNLEKGPRKVWAIGNKDAKIQNLSMGTELAGPLGYMEMLKTAMHELTGVPMNALSHGQPMSNTSATALHLQYMPAMQKDAQRKVQYTDLLKRVNSLIIRTAAVYEPQALVYNPAIASVPLRPTQYEECLPDDPTTYQSTVKWPSPLPMDVIVSLNEEQAKMAMGIQSKKGAVEALGNVFSDQKLREIFEELREDSREQAALNLLNAQASQLIIQATGATADGTPIIIPGVQGTDEEGNPTGMAPAVDPYLAQMIFDMAYSETPPERTDFDGS